MKRKQAIREYSEKLTSFMMVVFLLAVGIFGYFANRDFIVNFRPYYLNSYKEVGIYRAGNLISILTGRTASAESQTASTEAIPVLTYHGIVAGPPDESNVNIKNFAEQMFALKRAGYETITMVDYYNFIYRGKALPAKSFMLTFDDGRKDTYYPVEPILDALNYHAVMFVITEESFNKTSRFYLNRHELTQMKKSGHWDLEVHTKIGHLDYPTSTTTTGHFYSNKLYLTDFGRLETDAEYERRIKNDLEGAKKDLYDNLKIDSVAFAFPYGDVAENETNFPGAEKILLKVSGVEFPLSFYQYYPGRGYPENFRGSKSFLNRRIMVDPKWSAQDLLNLIVSSEDKNPPYSDIFYKDKGWLTISGETKIADKKMTLSSTGGSTGINYLNGTYLWDSYSVSAEAKIKPGATAQLYVNRQDSNNLVSCVYSIGRVRVEETVNGITRVVGETNAAVPFDQKFQIGAIVRGSSVVCLLDDQPVLASNGLDESLNFGGIGFEIWSPTTQNWLEISNLEVKPL